MNDVTQILKAIEQGDAQAADDLLPMVYVELRRLAAHYLAREPSGQTLQPTALVHEAYVRLVDAKQAQDWDSRGHFFAAAAQSMRRILIENARRKLSAKRGGHLQRADIDLGNVDGPGPDDDLLALDEALQKLLEKDTRAAKLVELRYFGGLTMEEAAGVLGVSLSTVKKDWIYARTWLRDELTDGSASE